MEIKETYAIFQGTFPEKCSHVVFSIENSKLLSEGDEVLIKKLRLDNLPENENNYITKFVLSNNDRFFKRQKLEAASTVKHRIPTIDNIPVNVKFPNSLNEEVERQVQEMLDSGIIKPSSSPYNSPLWIIPKKMDYSGTRKWRLVSDFRLLNYKTISDGNRLRLRSS